MGLLCNFLCLLHGLSKYSHKNLNDEFEGREIVIEYHDIVLAWLFRSHLDCRAVLFLQFRLFHRLCLDLRPPGIPPQNR